MTDKAPNYSPAQEALISDAVASNGGVANKAVAVLLSNNSAMNNAEGDARNIRSIIAKMIRMGFTYERQVPVTKSGEPVTKKVDLVSRIAAQAGVSASQLEGLEKAPKLVLETLSRAFAS